uniref:AHA1, activator of heat shock protein ATPase homolog 1a n=1 Tax=Cyprinus carpio TaxID=7962 RepID=A0A8C1T2D4_CYPCA
MMVTSWSQDAVNILLLGIRVEGEEGSCEITDISNIDGEASINNRKGKLIYFYKWVVKASWTGTNKMGIKYEGTVEIPNLFDENDMDDLDICVTFCKDLIRRHKPRSMIMKDTFLTSPEELYRVFLKQEMLKAFTHLAAFMDGSSGGKFRLLEGHVYGQFAELPMFITIIGSLCFNLSNDFFLVLIQDMQQGSETELILEARGVPSNEEERMKEGWQRYYFNAIKQTFGYGARLC